MFFSPSSLYAEEEEEKEEKIKDEELPMMQLGLRRGSEGFAP